MISASSTANVLVPLYGDKSGVVPLLKIMTIQETASDARRVSCRLQRYVGCVRYNRMRPSALLGTADNDEKGKLCGMDLNGRDLFSASISSLKSCRKISWHWDDLLTIRDAN